MKPERRRQGLVVTVLDDEVLVYDLQRHRAHCLNRTAARVFENCDGRTSVSELARRLEGPGRGRDKESVVWLALEKLEKAQLLAAPLSAGVPEARLSRRELMRGAVAASAFLLPAITSLVAPTPAEAAATCVLASACAGKPFGTPCSSTAPANCLCTCDGVGNCVGGC